MDENNITPVETISTIRVIPTNISAVKNRWYWTGIAIGASVAAVTAYCLVKEKEHTEHIWELERENRKLRVDNKLYQQRLQKFLDGDDEESTEE